MKDIYKTVTVLSLRMLQAIITFTHDKYNT